MNGNGLMTIKAKSELLKKHLDQRMVDIARALPNATMRPEHFARTVLTLCAKNPSLLDAVASNNGLASLLGAVMQSAQLGLSADPALGEAWFVPYKGIVQFQTGYKGLLKLAWQSDRIAKVSARVVREGDLFELEYGLHEKLRHIPKASAEERLTHAYATILTHGSQDPMFVCLNREEVDLIKARSPSARSNSSPWHTDYEAMAMKSALRRVCKLVPSSTANQNLQRAASLDELAENGLKQDLGALLGFDDSSEDAEREAALESMDAPKTESSKQQTGESNETR